MARRTNDIYRWGEQYIIEKLQNVKTPIFLVINKTDVATEEEILKAIVAYKDQCNFAEIIPVSALEVIIQMI